MSYNIRHASNICFERCLIFSRILFFEVDPLSCHCFIIHQETVANDYCSLLQAPCQAAIQTLGAYRQPSSAATLVEDETRTRRLFRMRVTAGSLSEQEFEALPPTLRRKVSCLHCLHVFHIQFNCGISAPRIPLIGQRIHAASPPSFFPSQGHYDKQ